MKTIWKFPMTVADEQEIALPYGFELLSVQTQRETPCLWALVDPENTEEELLLVCMYGTGHTITRTTGAFLGTFQIANGSLVFHVFTERKPA